MNKKTIVVKRKISGLVALFSWIFLVVMPSFIFISSLNKMNEITREDNEINCKSSLIKELERYKKDIELDEYLAVICRKVIDSCKSNNRIINPEYVIENLAKHNIEPALVVTHGTDSQNLKFWYSSELKNKKINLSRYFTEQLIIATNRQYKHSYYNKKLQNKYRKKYTKKVLTKIIENNNIFLKKKLSLSTAANLKDGEVHKSLSGLLKEQVYINYISLKQETNEKNYIKGGFFIVIKASQVNVKTMMKTVSESSTDNRIIRDFSVFSKNLNNFGESELYKISSFTVNNTGVHLSSPLPPNILVNIAQEGGIFPKHYKHVVNHLPLMKVTMPKAVLSSTLHQYTKIIYMLIKLFIIIGGIVFLRSFLFGLEFNISIRNKLIIGIVTVLIVPILLLMFSISIYADMSFKAYKSDKKADLRRLCENAQIQFNNFLKKKQLEVVNLSNKIKNFPKDLNNENMWHKLTDKIVGQWLKKNGAIESVISTQLNQFVKLKNKSIHNKEKLLFEIEKLRKALFSTLGEIARRGNVNNKYSYISRPIMNILSINSGMFFSPERLTSNAVFSTVKLISKLGKSIGIISIRFSKKALIDEFMKDYYKHNLNNKKQIQLSFFNINKPDNTIRKAYGKTAFSKLDLNNIQQTVHMQSSNSWESEIANSLHLNVTRYILPYPFLIAVSTTTEAKNSEILWGIAIIVYLIAFVIFIYIVFGKTYLEPIFNFTNLSRQIDKGQYDYKVVSSSIVEFNQLKLAFDNLTEGLKQKQALSRFVSDDVINDVESSEIINTGGEQIEATILFVSISKFSNFVKTNSPQNIRLLMNKFMTLSEITVTKYNGVIDKIIDGSLMLIFMQKSHVLDAAQTADEICKKAQLNEFVAKAGFATGNVIYGKIGSRIGRLDFTVIGDTVNMAARLKSEAEKCANETGIIIAPSSIRKIKGKAKLKFIKRTHIKGKSREYPLYELLGIRN